MGHDLGLPAAGRSLDASGNVPGRASEGALRALTALAASTTRICLRHRVTGLAAEAGFFALLSLPPLVLGLVGSLGFVGRHLGPGVVANLRARVSQLAGAFLAPASVHSTIQPMFDQVVHGNQIPVVSIGFLLALWSGSRSLNVYLDTISIMYGLAGRRGMLRTRALSFALYTAALVLVVVVLPLVLVGPGMLGGLLSRTSLPGWLDVFGVLYWPIVTLVAVAGLATLYHVATPVRTPWRRDLPGAVLALVIWFLASLALRRVIAVSVSGPSIYPSLATPILVLIWLYFLAIAVLVGAALNAAVDRRRKSR